MEAERAHRIELEKSLNELKAVSREILANQEKSAI
jgi:hypothetical protein